MEHEPDTGIEKIRAGPNGVVVKARGYLSYKIFVVRNGEIFYNGYDNRRANKVFSVLASGINIVLKEWQRENLA